MIWGIVSTCFAFALTLGLLYVTNQRVTEVTGLEHVAIFGILVGIAVVGYSVVFYSAPALCFPYALMMLPATLSLRYLLRRFYFHLKT